MSWKVDKILVPTDFSECARSALTQGVALARRYGADLHFLHVMMSHDEDPYSLVYQVSDRSDVYLQQSELCGSRMEELLRAQPTDGLRVYKHLLRAFSVAPAVLEFAAEESIDLLVIGGHGRRGWRRFLLGSVAEEIVRLASSPVLIVREGDRVLDFERLGRIVVPIDFSEHSRLALRTARELAAAGSGDAELELVHVVQLPVFPRYYDVMHDPSQQYAFPQIAVKVEEGIARFVREGGGPEVACQVRVLEGTPASAIVEHASSSDADLIVIATHGLSGLEHLLLGSVTEKVVRSAACPVLTLKAPEE